MASQIKIGLNSVNPTGTDKQGKKTITSGMVGYFTAKSESESVWHWGSSVASNHKAIGTVSVSNEVYTYQSKTNDGQNITGVGMISLGDGSPGKAAQWVVKLGGGDDNVAFADGGSRSTVDAGAGNDTIDLQYAASGSSVLGGSGNDVFKATDPAEGIVINAGAGNDSIDGTNIKGSTILGGDGKDTITSGGNNLLKGEGGNDIITVADGDTVDTGAGNDVVKMGSGLGKATLLTSGYTYGSDVISFANTELKDVLTLNADNAKSSFLSDGSIKDNDFTLTPSGTAAYYTVQVTDKAEKTYDVWYAGSAGTTINASGQTKSIYMVGNNNDDAGDYLVGGTGKDTIVAGTADSVNGGAGDDYIVIGGSNVYVGVSSTSAKDTVTGFHGSWDDNKADVVYLFDGFTSNTKVSANGSGTTISGGSAALTLSNVVVGGDDALATFLATDATGALKKIAVASSGSSDAKITASDGLADYYIGNNSALNASEYDNNLKVDLGNTGLYGSTANFSGITMVTGSSSNDNVLVGAAGTKNTLVGGETSNSIWGGGASNDSLVGGTNSNDTFFFGGGNGNDTVANYNADKDVVYVLGGTVTGASSDGSNTTIKFSDGKLVLEGVGSDVNTNISYTVDGATTKAVRVGNSTSANSFTYDSTVEVYYGGNQGDSLTVSGTDDAKVWLNGNDALGQYYTGITYLNGSGASGNVELAGSTKADTIVGGSGSSSIWGGLGAVNDTMEGGSGSNTFFFGLGEGKDVISSSNESDKVMLYNVNLAQVSTAAVDSSGNMVISLTDGSSLTVRNFTSQGATNFSLADGSYTYDKETNTWKNA